MLHKLNINVKKNAADAKKQLLSVVAVGFDRLVWGIVKGE